MSSETKDSKVQSKPFSILGMLNTFLRHSRLIVLGILAGATIGAISILIVPRREIAESTFVVEGDAASSSRTGALAAQFGISLGSNPSSVPDAAFYQDLLTSRAILAGAVQEVYDTPDGRQNLVQYYGVQGRTPDAKLNTAVGALRKDMSVSPDLSINVVKLRVTAESGHLATAINRNLLTLIARFNVEKRRTQSALERDFLQARALEARTDLRAAESRLEDFLERNRTYQTLPQLSFQAARLQQEVQIKRDIFTSVTQSYERARIDAARATPTFTIVDAPEGSAIETGQGPAVRAMIGAIVGLIIAAAIALLKEVAQQSRRAYPEEYDEFSRLKRSALKFQARRD
jgi:uncharacterized protein involved in exopolysaccharide biosynthesis